MHKLDRFFKPHRIALLGVTPNPKSVGGKVLSNLVGGGFRGVVYPVNPTSEAVLGIPCYPDVKSLPKTPDLALICTPAEQVPEMVQQCGEAGILGIIILSAGFREIGESGNMLEQKVLTEARRFDGMRIIGPNCLGIIVPRLNLNASFAQGMPQKGHVAFISQSGALCTSVLDWALEEKVGFSYFVSIGNTIDVDFGDLIDYFGEDEDTRSILLYIESIEHARKFMTAARSFARTKPIVAYKAGRFPESAAVAASHTGAMAAEDAVYDAAFQRAGLARVFDIGEIFDVAELIGRHKIPKGPRLGIVTNAGGPGVMATDALIAEQGVLATLSDQSMAALNDHLPHFWSHGNPVDVLGDAPPKRIARATEIVLEDAGVDAVLIIITPQAMTDPTLTAQRIGELADKTPKPILAAWLGGQNMREGIRLLNEVGIPTYTTPEQAVRAFMTMVAYSRNLESLYETPRDIPLTFSVDRDRLRQQFTTMIQDQGSLLSEAVSKKLLAAYGIPVTEPLLAHSAEEAVGFADQIGYPVVLKIQSPDIIHKTDVGGVALNLTNEDSVRQAFQRLMANITAQHAQARLDGITVQKMIQGNDSIELILGIKKDNVFGTVMMVGLGGITAELFGDRALGLPPLNERLARGMLESLKIWPLLNGFRGRPLIDIEQLIAILIRLSYLAADYPEIKELDINPLLVSPQEVVALDARIAIDRDILGTTIKPYAHLALRPYPEEYVKSAELKNGDQIILRPIKPEDEPMWMEMLASCSRESIYQRFRYFFQWAYHDVAVRYCFIDYDREIAIVAELNENGSRKLLGVGRLVGDSELETAEYAVLVADAWQEQGLGSMLTDYCIEIARQMGVKKIFAQTTTDNPRMIAVFRKRNFDIQIDPSSSLVEVALTLP